MHLLVILLPNYRTYPLQIGYQDETLQELSSGSFTIESWEHVHQYSGWGLALKMLDEVQQSISRVSTATTLEEYIASRALEEPWRSIINMIKLYLLIAPCFWLAR